MKTLQSKHIYWLIIAALTSFLVLKSCGNSTASTRPITDPDTPAINALKSKLTNQAVKNAVDSVTRVIALSKLPKVQKVYYIASNKVDTDIKSGVCDTSHVKQLRRAADSLNQVNSTIIKSDSLVIEGLRDANNQWRVLNDLQEKRHEKDQAVNDSLITENSKLEKKASRRFKLGYFLGLGTGAAAGVGAGRAIP